MLGQFKVHEPSTVSEAVDMLAHYGDMATVYAGGTELLLIMKEGLVHYPHLVNIKTIPKLNQISLDVDEDRLRIGALVTHRQLEQAALVREQVPLLSEAATWIGNLRVRVAGTIGGNLCFADPHSDPATVLLACGASLELSGVNGTRTVSVDKFFVGLLETAKEEHEVLTAITVPKQTLGTVGSYMRFCVHERPTATVAVTLELKNGFIDRARIALGSVGPIPIRITKAEELLQGERPNDGLYVTASKCVVEATDAVDDIYGSVVYKRHLAQLLTYRGLIGATQNHGGGHSVGKS